MWMRGFSGSGYLQDQGGAAIAGGTPGPQKISAPGHDGFLDAFDDQADGGGALGMAENQRRSEIVEPERIDLHLFCEIQVIDDKGVVGLDDPDIIDCESGVFQV